MSEKWDSNAIVQTVEDAHPFQLLHVTDSLIFIVNIAQHVVPCFSERYLAFFTVALAF